MAVSESGPKSGGPLGMAPLLTGALERIEELYNSGGDITGLTTGFIDLDKRTSGLQPSDLVIVAGRPSMGKTSFAMNLVENATPQPETHCCVLHGDARRTAGGQDDVFFGQD